MWWRTVLVFNLLAIIDNIPAQDVNGTGLCCPCPPGWPGAAAPAPVASAARDVGDCPCRARDADSEGAASLLFPHAVRAFGNVVRPDAKEDSKPLLHPEVDLASSVLETLREATDEEYRDALERDAARASDVMSFADVIPDGNPEEARNVVTIIVSPRDMNTDDALPEASHVQETRCIHSPLGIPRAPLTFNRASVPQKGIEDILDLPLPSGLLHRQRDSNLAASNIKKNVVKADDTLNTILSRHRLRTDANVLHLDPKNIGENLNNTLNIANLGSKTRNDNSNSEVTTNQNIEVDSIGHQLSSELVQEDDNIDSNVLAENDFNRESNNQANLDCDTSPTINNEAVFENSAKNTGLLKSLLLARNNKENSPSTFPLKNLFKLKDVELVPLDILKNIPKSKANIPIIKLNPLRHTEARDPVKFPPQPALFDTKSKINKAIDEEKSAHIQTIPKRKAVSTHILDAVPSPSGDNCVKMKPDKSAGFNMQEVEDILLNSSSETVETDDEQSRGLIAKKGDNTAFTDITSGENTELTKSEDFENYDFIDSENVQIIEDTLVPEQEINSDIQILSLEDEDAISPSAVDLSEINEDRSSAVPEIRKPLKTLEEIRNSVVDRLDALQKSNRNALNSIKHNVEQISTPVNTIEEQNRDVDLTDNENEKSNEQPVFEPSSPARSGEEEMRDTCTSLESVSYQDLQKMSDSILQASEKVEQRAEPTEGDSTDSKKADSESEEISESEIDNVLGMDDAQMESKETNHSNDLNQIDDNTDGANAEKVCPTDLSNISEQNKLKQSNADNNENTENDLEPLASDPIMDILRPTSLTSEPIINIFRPNSKTLVEHLNDFETKLRQSIVQPTPFINTDDFNIFRTPTLNIPDISGLNANIPTLEEIRTRVSEILDGLARTAGEDDNSSEPDSDDFASEVNPVLSTSSSSSRPASILPSLKPLEDINLDIVQLKPLPSLLGSSLQMSNLPGLNLNRYKAKLVIPKSLDLKPLNLASTLGNNGGLVGATLSIGPEKKGKIVKADLRSKSNPDLVKSFRGPLNNNPTIADITSSVHKNALNLLNIPKSTKRPILQASNIIENFAEGVRFNSEDTLRSIHQSLKPSALNDINNNLFKSANNLLTSGRSSLEKSLRAPTPIDSVVDNIRSQTKNNIKQLHNTLNSPVVPDLGSAIKKNTHNFLKSSRTSVDSVVDNIRAQSENNFRNIQHTLDTSALTDISDSLHKTTQNILKPSPLQQEINMLGNTMHAIPSIDEVADNLRAQTEHSLKTIHQTLKSPSLSDIRSSIQKSAQQVLKSPITNHPADILKSSLQPSMSIDTVVDNLKSQTQNTMRNIQDTLNTPALTDISATMQKHAQNLLKAPVALTGRDAFEQVLQAGTPMNLAPHAEQIAKDFQKTLKATLKNNPIKDLHPLPHPNDVIQMISDHQEDVNEKLYAIHTDLNDRLETIHNEITDPDRLRSILTPPGNRNFELFAIPLPMGPKNVPITRKLTKPTLQAKQPSFETQRIQSKKPTSTVTARSRTNAVKPDAMRSSSGKGNISPKSFRIPSASSPIPTRINRPPLQLTPKKPFQDFPELQSIKKPVFPKYKPLTQNKVTVTFGPTTQRPIAPVGKTTPKPRVTNNKRFKPKAPVRQPTPWNGWGAARSFPKLGEPLTSPTGASASVRAPLKVPPTKSIAKPVKTGLSRLSTVSPKPKSSSKANSKMTPLTQSRTNPGSKLLPLNKPRTPFLSTLSETLKNKQTDPKLGLILHGPNREEMAPAASDRLEKVVPLEEPMKENVSYKCKMMCVKVDLNDE